MNILLFFFTMLLAIIYIAYYLTHITMSMNEVSKVKVINFWEVRKKVKKIDWLSCYEFKNSLFYDYKGTNEWHAGVLKIDGVVYILYPIGFLLFSIFASTLYKKTKHKNWHQLCEEMVERNK